MAHLANHTESDLMRAITHARLLVTSGQGLESIIHELATRNLGTVSVALQAVEADLARGKDGETALQDVAEKVNHEHMKAFLYALRANGSAALSRLDDLVTAVQAGWQQTIDAYGTRVQRIIGIIAVVFLGTFVPPFLHVFERIPPNPFGIEFHFPYMLEMWLYSIMATLIGIFLVVLRFR